MASFDTTGFAGNSTGGARRMVSFRSMASWDWSSPKGRLPYSIWYRMTPAAHTSTLEEINGGWLPRSKHSGGRYLKTRAKMNALTECSHCHGILLRREQWLPRSKHSGGRYLKTRAKEKH